MTEQLAYRHSHFFERPCPERNCGSVEYRHAGYGANGLTRYWRCVACGKTAKVSAEYYDHIDHNGVGRLRPIQCLSKME